MYELSVAYRYLLPRLRQISVSIISLISILVISLVVWLIIVFFSATDGLERLWTERLVAITGPIRITPNEQYYASYYYKIDMASGASQFQAKTLTEKQNTTQTDPYNPQLDPPLPASFPQKEFAKNGKELNILQNAYKALASIPGMKYSIFETAFAQLEVYLTRKNRYLNTSSNEFITHPCYLVNRNTDNTRFSDSLMPYTEQDRVELQRLGVSTDPSNTVTSSGDPIFLPKDLFTAGVRVADTGILAYHVQSTTGVQQANTPVFVAGFYDPGIIPLGGKIVLAPLDLVSAIRSSMHVDETLLPSGISVQCVDLANVATLKNLIVEALEREEVSSYFTVQTYYEFDFTRDIFNQLKSERNLFSLISIIIIIVACSNIVSMLIILVHDKAKEIAILRALGATKKSIGYIFGISGLFMGIVGSCIGSTAAYFTVKNLPLLLKGLSKLQGFEVLNTAFFGSEIPTDISLPILVFVVIVTAVIATVAALVPAIQASRQNTQAGLRYE